MKMPWGKYKGTDLEDIPSPYIKWLSEECDNETIAEEADEEWQFREKFNNHFYEDYHD